MRPTTHHPPPTLQSLPSLSPSPPFPAHPTRQRPLPLLRHHPLYRHHRDRRPPRPHSSHRRHPHHPSPPPPLLPPSAPLTPAGLLPLTSFTPSRTVKQPHPSRPPNQVPTPVYHSLRHRTHCTRTHRTLRAHRIRHCRAWRTDRNLFSGESSTKT